MLCLTFELYSKHKTYLDQILCLLGEENFKESPRKVFNEYKKLLLSDCKTFNTDNFNQSNFSQQTKNFQQKQKANEVIAGKQRSARKIFQL